MKNVLHINISELSDYHEKYQLKTPFNLPIALLGLVALLSNILSITNSVNVNASASISQIIYGCAEHLAQICQSSMSIQKMALSHIVATDYNTHDCPWAAD